jgi:hypothetical protein
LAILIPAARAEYYGSKTSNKYHYKTCRWFPLIKPSKLLVFQTPEEAARSGYIPCPTCRPPKPKQSAKEVASGKPSRPAELAEKTEPPLPIIADEPAKSSVTEKRDDQPAPKEESKYSKSADVSSTIHEIKFQKSVDGMEKVVIYLDRFYIPGIRSFDGDKPTINIYFHNGSLVSEQKLEMETGGNFVRRIKIQHNDPANQLVVMLEMAPFTAFSVNPIFYEKENIYLLEITRLKNTSP